jgi:amino acid transporter
VGEQVGERRRRGPAHCTTPMQLPCSLALGKCVIFLYSLWGTGSGRQAGFEIGIVMLVLFSVGYVKMMRSVPSSGGFYSFISHGLGRPFGLGAGWSAIFAYAFVVGSLMGALGYFGNITIQQFFHFGVPWPYLAFGALVVIFLLGHFDVRISSNVLGIALIGEM